MFDGQFAPYQPLQFEAWQPPGYGLSVAATIVYTASNSISTDLTTYTHASLNLGTAGANRKIIVAVMGSSGGAATEVNTVSAGGTALNHAFRATVANGIVEFWIGTVAAGTSGDIVVVYNGSTNRSAVGVWAAYDILSDIPTDTGESSSDPGVVSIDVAAGGVIVAAVYSSSGTVTYTWTNLTESYDIAVETSRRASGAADAFASALTGRSITADGSAATTQNMAVVAFR
jgi:hypothetical protein